MNTDFSSGAMSAAIPAADGSIPGVQMFDVDENLAGFQRNWLGRIFTGTDQADLQDFNRAELSANNQLMRDLALQNNANAFSSSEAQKQRDFEERMSNTSYQRALQDMKIAGINPVLMLPSQGGASTPSGATASASSAGSGSGNYRNKVVDNSAQFLGMLAGALISSVTQGVLASKHPSGKTFEINNYIKK